MKKPSTLAGNLIILSTALLWSTGGVLVKFLPWGSFSIACLRGLICALVLLSLRYFRRGKEKMKPVRLSKYNVGSGIAMFLTAALYLAANKMTTAANAIVLQYIAPILILLYTALVQKRRPPAMEIFLTAIVFLGCVLAFSDRLGGTGVWGDILALLSGVTFAALILINRLEKTQVEDGQIIGCSLSFLCCLPLALTDTKLVFTWESTGAILALSLFQYSLANILFGKGIKMTEPTAASIILTMEPIMNPVWVFLAFGEAPGLRALLGFALVITAVTLHTVLPLLIRKSRPGNVEATVSQAS